MTTTIPATDVEAQKALVRRFIDEVFLKGDFSAVDELMTDDFISHTSGPGGSGKDGMKETIKRVSAGLSDPSMKIEDMIVEDDRVVVRLTGHAVQTGEFMGMPPSGKSYTIGEIHIFRIRDGKVAEHWHQADFLGMMRQLGMMPEIGGKPSND